MVSVVISGFVALTLTPALCTLILKKKEPKPFAIVKKFNVFFDWLTEKFTLSVSNFIRRGLLLLALFAVFVGLTGGLFWNSQADLSHKRIKGHS